MIPTRFSEESGYVHIKITLLFVCVSLYCSGVEREEKVPRRYNASASVLPTGARALGP